MLMVQAFFPLIDGVTAALLTGLEALKGYFGIKVAEYNMRIRKISDEESKKRPIGFVMEKENDE
jgi:hypothetical protein